jgi:CO/xanthine dehydrogenase FAD-binding subunit
MIGFHYSRAANVADAVSQMSASPGAKFIAGGTNLVDLMKMDVEQPSKLSRRHPVACASVRSCPISISPITR